MVDKKIDQFRQNKPIKELIRKAKKANRKAMIWTQEDVDLTEAIYKTYFNGKDEDNDWLSNWEEIEEIFNEMMDKKIDQYPSLAQGKEWNGLP